jgi:hypothetical protein
MACADIWFCLCACICSVLSSWLLLGSSQWCWACCTISQVSGAVQLLGGQDQQRVACKSSFSGQQNPCGWLYPVQAYGRVYVCVPEKDKISCATLTPAVEDKYKSLFTYTDCIPRVYEMLMRVQVGQPGRHDCHRVMLPLLTSQCPGQAPCKAATFSLSSIAAGFEP